MLLHYIPMHFDPQAALEVKDIKIAEELINNILQVSYQGLSAKIKKVGGACDGHMMVT